jgi:hypothetical protein
MTGKHIANTKIATKGIELTKEILDQIFEYRDGDLYWKPVKAGTVDGSGYLQIGIKGKYYKNHRLIFLMHHGYLPELIDHADGDRQNNKIGNLREATRSQNNYNKKINKSNKSGVKGVSWRPEANKWRARIYVERKVIMLGMFDSIDDAKKAIEKARKIHHKDFAKNG